MSLNWNYRISFVVFFSLAVLFWMLSGNAYADLEKQPPITTFQNVGKLLAEDYDKIARAEAQAKEPLPFSLWSQFDNEYLESPDMGRSQNVSWLAVKGDTRLILPVAETLYEEDTGGCLIDKRTAEKLFADANAAGGTVKLSGREYTVRGVIGGPAYTIVTQLAAESDVELDNISVSGTENADTFLMRHNLSDALTVKSDQYVRLAKILYSLPIIAVLLVALLLLNLVRIQYKDYPIRQMAVSMSMLIVCTAGFLLLIQMIPEKLIPSQWADFEFWSTSGRDLLQCVIDFMASAKYRPDLIRLGAVLQSATGILSAWFILRLYYLNRIHSGNMQLQMLLRAVRLEALQSSDSTLQRISGSEVNRGSDEYFNRRLRDI